ncbi:MAG: polyprenyl synthetase family protein [Pseudomonadales bacterium]
MKAFLQDLQPELRCLNDVITTRLRSKVALVEEIGEHLIEAGGKRLRPLLTIIAAQAISPDEKPQQIHDLAAVIEFLHTATLLHDDVIDVSALRRGRPTANATWGNAPSVLVGDFLYSRAFQMLVEINHSGVMAELADTTNLIAEGEVLQLTRAGDPDTTEAQYLEVIHFKTARLFAAAARCGAMLANSESPHAPALASYGHSIGMAFQLMDDYLDYAGNAEVMGKNVGDDLAEGKPTLPLIKAMQTARGSDALMIRTAIQEKSSEHLAAISACVRSCGALEATIQLARRYTDDALTALAPLPDSQARQQLQTLASLAVTREA